LQGVLRARGRRPRARYSPREGVRCGCGAVPGLRRSTSSGGRGDATGRGPGCARRGAFGPRRAGSAQRGMTVAVIGPVEWRVLERLGRLLAGEVRLQGSSRRFGPGSRRRLEATPGRAERVCGFFEGFSGRKSGAGGRGGVTESLAGARPGCVQFFLAPESVPSAVG
jgi:hypothetical protein